MALVAMSKYKLREGRVTSKALLCLFILSKIKYKAHSVSSRTAVRFFVCSGGDENADIWNSTIIFATKNEFHGFRKRQFTFTDKISLRIHYEIRVVFLHVPNKHIKLVFDDITVILQDKSLQSDVYI